MPTIQQLVRKGRKELTKKSKSRALVLKEEPLRNLMTTTTPDGVCRKAEKKE